MSEEIILTAKTVDEAIKNAEAQYAGQGEISYEILELPKKGFLGIKSSPAKIKVSVITEEDKKAEAAKRFQPKPKPEAKPTPKPQAKPASKPEAKADAQSAAPFEKREFVERERPAIVISEEEMKIALDFVNTMLKNMESEATAVQAVAPEGEVFEGVYPKIEIVGDNSGILIGHHGDTLDAIQFLTNLSVNRKTGSGGREFVKIVVDIENYRAKREETLRTLARRMAQKAVKYKRNMVLEPMNPYERRIIHSELQTFENVDTHSVGSDENRKIVITYEGADKVERRPRTQNSRDNRRPRSAQTSPREEAPKTTTPPARKLTEEESAEMQQTYAAYQEEKAGRERPRRATSIDEVLGKSDEPDEPAGL